MPLLSSTDPTDALSLAEAKTDFLVFYSSVDGSNQMWCPDCRRVENAVRHTFDQATAPSALIVYVGQRGDWKGNPENAFRTEPWRINSVPTIVRI
ncbi:hypothetical protein DFH11DRAFT_26863 [Phellopilus nigrolimitatus]|nr:hypothetical protein DFH11DRAFT_26863 [Phellopilus nigrolimitatus]